MTKYNFDFKLKVVLAHLTGEGGYKAIDEAPDFPTRKRLRNE